MGNKEDNMTIYFNRSGEGTASLVPSDVKSQSEVIHLRTVDLFCTENNIQHIDFMKIDVE
jgi:ribosomal protein L25 (general stress protein Ctc)